LGRFGVMESCSQPRAHLVRFRDSHRWLYAWVMFGAHPSGAARIEVQAILDSLTIAPQSVQ